MKMKLFGWVLFAAASFALTGCSSVTNYSIRSYQGPMPLSDYQYVSPETYGVPIAAR